MKFVALSGGIGSGKSTVGGLLTARGADVIDVDQLSRDLQQPGRPLFDRIVGRWGSGVLASDGTLDRAALGAVVFADQGQLIELTSMAAPYTEAAVYERTSAHIGTDDVVVMETAIASGRMYGQEGVLLVDTPTEVAISRLVAHRRFTETDARARVSKQLPRDERLKHADFVIDNRGDLGALAARVAAAWEWIMSLPDAAPRLSP